jgi:hypothetical protein
MADDERRAEAEVEAVAYPIFVGVAKAPWTRRDDDELCPVEPFSKNHARNLARAAIKELDRVRDARGDDEGPALNQTCCSGCTEAVRDEEPLRFRSGVLWHEACLAARSPQDEDHEVPCPRCDGTGCEGGNTISGGLVCSLCHGTGKQVVRSPQDEDHEAMGPIQRATLAGFDRHDHQPRCSICGHLLQSHALKGKGPCMVGCGCRGGSPQDEDHETSDAVRGDLHGTPGEWPERQPMATSGSGTPQAQPARGRQSEQDEDHEREATVYWCPRCDVQSERMHHFCERGPAMFPQLDEYTTCTAMKVKVRP